MGKKDEQKAKPVGNGNNRVQGFVFGINLQGTEEVVTEGIKAFTQALASSGLALAPAPATRGVLVAAKPNGNSAPAGTAAAPAATDIDDQVGPEAEEQTSEIEEQLEEDAEEESSSNGNGAKRNYNYRPPKFLDDLDLTKTSKPVADFMAEKGNPSETNDRYIAVAVWLKEHMNIETFTINHIFTVFDNLGWKAQIPVNHSQPLRDLKTKRHFLTKNKDGYQVNWQGTQYVANMGASK